jgi:hypothetical protein
VLLPAPMEVVRLTEYRGTREEPFDLSRLKPEERELWDKYFAGPLEDNEGPVLRAWCFGYLCMLELWGPPKVVAEYLHREDPENLVKQYLENVRRARGAA